MSHASTPSLCTSAQHCGTVVAVCNGLSMTPIGQHICPLSLFIARPFAGYRAIGFRPLGFMVLRLLGDTSPKYLGKAAAVEDFNVLYQVAFACRSPSSGTSCRSGRPLSLERPLLEVKRTFVPASDGLPGYVDGV